MDRVFRKKVPADLPPTTLASANKRLRKGLYVGGGNQDETPTGHGGHSRTPNKPPSFGRQTSLLRAPAPSMRLRASLQNERAGGVIAVKRTSKSISHMSTSHLPGAP